MRMNTFDSNNAQRWDQQALAEIYEQYSPRLYRYAIRLLGDPDQAEECVAETFSRFLHALHTGHGPDDNLQAYLYRAAHNWITDYYRRQPPVDQLGSEGPSDPFGNPVHVVTRQLEQERVRKALLQLNPLQQQIISLRFLEEWSHAEVAAVIGKTVEATRALQSRALAALRSSLVDQEE